MQHKAVETLVTPALCPTNPPSKCIHTSYDYEFNLMGCFWGGVTAGQQWLPHAGKHMPMRSGRSGRLLLHEYWGVTNMLFTWWHMRGNHALRHTSLLEESWTPAEC